MTNILFSLEKIGPYHNSRFNSILDLKEFNLNVLESDPLSVKYPWKEKLCKRYRVFKFKENIQNNSNFKNELSAILKECSPNIIFITGWDQKISHYLLVISHLEKIPVVIISDSRFKDSKRNFFLESLKKILLGGCSSAIVAGFESENYIAKLGFKNSAIFKPYDVIDNDFFSNSLNKLESNKYILCVARFIKKKNHLKLIKAFEKYKKNNGSLNLIIIGEGPEKQNIINFIKTLSCESSIAIKSWQGIDELKKFYANAKVFVLFSQYDQWGLVVNEAMASGIPCIVSTECGCYEDLIKNKNTGWGVDPTNEQELTNIFHLLDKLKEKELIRIQQNIRKTIKNYNLKEFSKAVKDATKYAMKNKKSSKLSALAAYLLFLFK